MISNYIKDFSWKKKDPNTPDFEGERKKKKKKKKFKSPDFCDKFQQVAKNIEGFWFFFFFFFFLLSYLVCSQIHMAK
jgi:hypothetical protein